MRTIKQYIKNNQFLFSTLKHGLLYVRYAKSLIQKDTYTNINSIEAEEQFEIKEKKYHCFFGYYDKSPINETNEYIAFLRVKDGSKSKDNVDICIMYIPTKETTVIGHTTTWNWQQGCMLQWVDKYVLSFNDYNDESKLYVTLWMNIKEKIIVGQFSRAAYSYNKDHTKFLSLNFYRLDLYAKGYGYPYLTDDMATEMDGIWENHLQSGKIKMLATLKQVMEHEPKNYFDYQHYINHVAYTPDEQSIIFIHRWQRKGGEFISRLLSYNLISGQLHTILDNGHVSHYCWEDNDTLLIYATDRNNQKGYMEVNIRTMMTHIFDGLVTEDGHPSFSNDHHWILTDTYPNWKRYQHLFLFDNTKKELKVLDKLWSPFRYYNDERCDLHPRWSMDSNYICADNTQSGYRSIRVYKIPSVC